MSFPINIDTTSDIMCSCIAGPWFANNKFWAASFDIPNSVIALYSSDDGVTFTREANTPYLSGKTNRFTGAYDSATGKIWFCYFPAGAISGLEFCSFDTVSLEWSTAFVTDLEQAHLETNSRSIIVDGQFVVVGPSLFESSPCKYFIFDCADQTYSEWADLGTISGGYSELNIPSTLVAGEGGRVHIFGVTSTFDPGPATLWTQTLVPSTDTLFAIGIVVTDNVAELEGVYQGFNDAGEIYVALQTNDLILYSGTSANVLALSLVPFSYIGETDYAFSGIVKNDSEILALFYNDDGPTSTWYVVPFDPSTGFGTAELLGTLAGTPLASLNGMSDQFMIQFNGSLLFWGFASGPIPPGTIVYEKLLPLVGPIILPDPRVVCKGANKACKMIDCCGRQIFVGKARTYIGSKPQ